MVERNAGGVYVEGRIEGEIDWVLFEEIILLSFRRG